MNRLPVRLGDIPLPHTHHTDLDDDFEPSCIVRTPSGNVYIPADVPKSALDYKTNSSCCSPSKDLQKNDRNNLGYGHPVHVQPVRNNLRRPTSTHHFPPPRFQFQKGFASRCSWKCTAVVFILLSLVLTATLAYMTLANILHWSYESTKACTVLVNEESSESLAKILPDAGINRNTSVSRPKPSATPASSLGGMRKYRVKRSKPSSGLEEEHAFDSPAPASRSQLPLSLSSDINLTPSLSQDMTESPEIDNQVSDGPSTHRRVTDFESPDRSTEEESFPQNQINPTDPMESLPESFSSDSPSDSQSDYPQSSVTNKIMDSAESGEHIGEETPPIVESVPIVEGSSTFLPDILEVAKSNLNHDSHGAVSLKESHLVAEGSVGTNDEALIPSNDEPQPPSPIMVFPGTMPSFLDLTPDSVSPQVAHVETHDRSLSSLQHDRNLIFNTSTSLINTVTPSHAFTSNPDSVVGPTNSYTNLSDNISLRKSLDSSAPVTTSSQGKGQGDWTTRNFDEVPVDLTARPHTAGAKQTSSTSVDESPESSQENSKSPAPSAQGLHPFTEMQSDVMNDEAGVSAKQISKPYSLETLRYDKKFDLSNTLYNVDNHEENSVPKHSINVKSKDANSTDFKIVTNRVSNEEGAAHSAWAKNASKSVRNMTNEILQEGGINAVRVKNISESLQDILSSIHNVSKQIPMNLTTKNDGSASLMKNTNTGADQDSVHGNNTTLHEPDPVLTTTSQTKIKLGSPDLLFNESEPNRVFIDITFSSGNEQTPKIPFYTLRLSVPTAANTLLPRLEFTTQPSGRDQTLRNEGKASDEENVFNTNTEEFVSTTESNTVESSSLARDDGCDRCVCTCPDVNDVNPSMSIITESSFTGIEDGSADKTAAPLIVKNTAQASSSSDSTTQSVGNHTSREYTLQETSSEVSENPSIEIKPFRDPSSTSTPSSVLSSTVTLPYELKSEMTSELTEDYEDSESTEVGSATPKFTVEENQVVCPTPPPPLILVQEGTKTFPARSFPPDGTTFAQISIGQKLSNEIPPYGYWNMQFYQSEAAYIKFDFNIPRGANIAMYARRNALPTHTQYHILEVLSGYKARLTRASHQTSVKKEIMHYLEPGHWFLSLYNDDGDAQEVILVAAVSDELTKSCPGGCNGKGQCLMGRCQCTPGFGGEDCSESVCPVLCSQRGEYVNGECQCNPGWKGKECNLRHDECEVPDCNGHGHCSNGKCVCARGFKGKFCEEADCPHPTCSGHGFCIAGQCVCKKGWKSNDCSEMDKDALQCLPDCSGHGKFDLETQSCICEAMWSGEDCSRELCDLDCGLNGHCVGNTCQCNPGWTGDFCNQKLCDTRCNDHGQCKNGTCLCVTGWNGRHCTLEGCPNSCSGHGQCRVNSDSQWECRCSDGWDGKDCSVLLEQNCGDGRDNDKDGLMDCEDPECCSNHLCRSSQLCVLAPKPIDILLRKQPPAITASFFERMKFLIEEGSLQNYAKQENFNESRSAVVRGRVVTQMGMGLMGVRVSTSIPLEGFTLTRDDGWFDILVNGGGAVTLQFGRSPFKSQSRIINVPWNEVVIIDTIVLQMGDEKALSTISSSCKVHDYDLMKPVVLATWKHGFQGACPDRSSILAESQVVQESFQIPGTGLNLIYHSSRSAGYLSTIQLQLTPETIPETLQLIHLRITIEGILFEKTFEADPGIKFTYAWNRLNVYRQRVYGVTTALVKVGYQYKDCRDIMWDVQTTKLSGHDMSISEVGGWNLDIHHRYNFHEGILQKGDGSNIYLKHKPRIIKTTLGDGHQRPFDCSTECDGTAGTKQRLLAPVALAAAPDGSIFVGDFNLIRRIMVDGTVKTVVRLNVTRVSYRYHIALSPLDGTVYISDPESHQILKIRDPNDFSNPDHNWTPAVGSGERCLPGDEAHCGDGALARDAKLAYPKGVAVAGDNTLYFADGTNIRMVDRDGIITTVVGNHMHKSHWKPIPCEGTLNIEEVHLRWPTDLAINPLDDTLHIIDDHMVLQLTTDNRVKVVAGRPLHCPAKGHSDIELATHATLVMPQSIAFGPNGDLYVAESDSQRINRVRIIGTDGKIMHYVGAESRCNCLDRGCDCFEQDHFLATSSKFNTISSIIVSPDGILHIADQANYRIRSVIASLPEANAAREYEVYSPESQELYIFNRFGQHIATKNILTGEMSYIFTYTVNTSNGKLSTVTDSAGNKVFLLRDYSSQVNSIENTKGQKCRLRLSKMKLLSEISTPDNYNVTFDYHGPSGLMKSKLDSTGRSYVYNYDEFGRLTGAVTPTGKIVKLSFDLSVKGAMVKVTYDDKQPVAMLIKGSTVVTKRGEAEYQSVLSSDNSVSTVAPWGHTISIDTVSYPILADIDPVLAESYPVPAKQKTDIGGDLANRFEWKYSVRHVNKNPKEPIAQVVRKLRINGDNLLSLEYDRETGTVAVFMDDRVELLNVTYDRTSRPTKWGARNGMFAGVELDYDRFGRLSTWRWGGLNETYHFDRAGRLAEIRYADDKSMLYTFKDMFSGLPLKVTTPRGSDYLLQYDDAGALQSLTTPRGHIHAFSLQTSLGFFKYQYYSPTSRHPYELRYNDEGQVVAKLYPHQSGRVAYVYDQSGKLDTVLAGLSSIHYTYQESTSLLKNIDVIEPGFELKHEFHYHMGIPKDEKLKFGSKSGLHNTHYRFQFDGNARISEIEVGIDGKELPQLKLKYNQNLGTLEGMSDLRIYRNTFNRSVIQDTSKQFFSVTEYDAHGRIKNVLINVKSLDVYRMELDYDTRSRIMNQKIMLGRTTSTDRMSYTADGHILEVIGNNNWKYVYDENGNKIGVMEGGQKITLGYDSGDRVTQVGDVELNGYDARGFVIRRGEVRLRYNERGQLSHAIKANKFSAFYRYDDRGRLIAIHNTAGNITQLLYADPMRPDLVSHLHYPKIGTTFRYLYDEKGFIVAVETSEQRFYVATDQNGSPVALFDTNGNIIKEFRRTPFGHLVRDSNPNFFLPVDFQGGIPDPHTGLLYLKKRWYDPSVGQWLTPEWERLADHLSVPTDIFVYRFHNNDPINPKASQEVNYMIDLNSWLKLYGYDVEAMLGSAYTSKMIYQCNSKVHSPQLAPDFGVMSGLGCIVDKVKEQFSHLGFVAHPLLKSEARTRNLLPRVAYRKAVFGEGLLISRTGNGRALVSIVEGVNSVVQDVVTSVFNNSFFLDLHFSQHDQDLFYFVKDNGLKLRDDLEELRRLGGMFNVSTHETGDGKELRLHSTDAIVSIRYGSEPQQERHRLLKHAHKRAVDRAWEIEKSLVASGLGGGRGDWTPEEQEELTLRGKVEGYEGIDIHSIQRYPQLADDPGNVAFRKEASRRKRKRRTHKRLETDI